MTFIYRLQLIVLIDRMTQNCTEIYALNLPDALTLGEACNGGGGQVYRVTSFVPVGGRLAAAAATAYAEAQSSQLASPGARCGCLNRKHCVAEGKVRKDSKEWVERSALT